MLTHKLAALLLAVSFQGTVVGDAWGVHDCPHHDMLPPVAASEAANALGAPEGAAGAPGHGGHGSDAGYGGHGAAASAASAHASAAHAHDGGAGDCDDCGHGPCTCVGHCQTGGSGTAALAMRPRVVLAVPPASWGLPSVRLVHDPLPGPTPYLLPFANAPPRTS